MDERITIKAKRKGKTGKLGELLGGLGFSKVDYSKDTITVHKIRSSGLEEKASMDYGLSFGKDKIELFYSIPAKATQSGRLVELFPVFLDSLRLALQYYEIDASSLFPHFDSIMRDLMKAANKDSIDLASELQDLKTKHAELSKKYSELARSSEENARILLECERRRDELYTRVQKLHRLSDDVLKEELYKWIRVHGGGIDISEFCASHSISPERAEEGLEMLLREGYIKKRSEQ